MFANALLDGFPIAMTAYAGVALLYLVLWKGLPKTGLTPEDASTGKFWIAVAILLLTIGLVKEFHLGEELVNDLRQMAKESGWYGERRAYQTWLIIGVFVGGFVGAGLATYWFADKLGGNIALFIAITYLLIFKAIDACSLHQVDAILGIRFGGLSVRNVIEFTLLVAIALIGISHSMIIRKRLISQ